MAVLTRILYGLPLAIALLCATADAQTGNYPLSLPEQKIKAGLLYNFLKYTQWPIPGGEEGSMTVCLWGGDAFSGSLHPMNGRIVNQREILLREVDSMEEVEQCHLLYVNAAMQKQWPGLAEALKGKSVLTVSDFDGFVHNGGMIEFSRKDQRIQVEVNLQAIKDAHLMVQESLLRLASVVHPASAKKVQ